MPAMSAVRGMFRAVLVIAVAGAASAAWSAEDPAGRTIVLANGNVPESIELARYYLQARGIPSNHLCVLDLPTGEIMSRGLYEFRLRDPLLEFLRKGDFIQQVLRDADDVRPHETAWITLSSSVRYLVSMYGVPLRIADTRWKPLALLGDRLRRANDKNTAAVDSELALLLLDGYDIQGPHANPLFNQYTWDDLGPSPPNLLVAARLDGPDPATVRRMIDDTLWAERYGLLGRAYFDGRNLPMGSYAVGDYWVREACERFAREGYECILNSAEDVWGPAYPMEDAAVYMGWYTEDVAGPFLRPDFRFRKGAIAYHIHSGSAATLRTASKRWAGPLLALGAAATLGAVHEPFLNFTPQLHLFADRLCRGHNFGDSAYMSLLGLSWQVTVVGDPLYQPFKYSLDEQIQNLEKDGRPEVEWAYLRSINRMVREERFNVAMEFCRRKLQERESLVLREKLGDLYAKNDLFKEAGKEYEIVIEKAQTAETAVRVGARWIKTLRLLGEKDRADRLEAGIRERWKGSLVLPWLDTAKVSEN